MRGALKLFQSAVRLAPNHSDAAHWHFPCRQFARLERRAESIEAPTKFIELDADTATYGITISVFGSIQAGAWRMEQWKELSSRIEDLNKTLNLSLNPVGDRSMAPMLASGCCG
jgi:hypothetical protein